MNTTKLSQIPIGDPSQPSLDRHVTTRGGTDVLVSTASVISNVAPTLWNGATGYVVGQQVIFQDNIYSCINSNSNKQPPNTTYWALNGPKSLDAIQDGAAYARTLAIALESGVPYTFKGSWSNVTNYLVGQEVSYLGNYWIAINNNTNSTPSPANGDWGLEGTSALYIGPWSGLYQYKEGMQVSRNDNLYSCTKANNNQQPPNPTYWLLVGPQNLDAVSDGGTYARVLASALTDGIPTPFQGVWSSIVTYLPGQEVEYSGNYWTCLASNLNSAPSVVNDKWQQVGTLGSSFQGAYDNAKAYSVGNEVTYGSPAGLYICIVNSTGNLPTDTDFWQLLSTVNTSTYLGTYDAGTSYVVGNQVKYLGDYYICISPSLGNAPSTTSGYWTLVGTSALFLGAWSNAVAYVKGNQVLFSGNCYTCILANTNETPPNPSYWQLVGPQSIDYLADGASYARTAAIALQSGIPYTYQGAWNNWTNYKIGQEVTYLGAYWIAVANNTNSAPTQANINWGLEGTAALLLGAWSGLTPYVVSNQVTLGGNIYSCILAHTNHTPPNITYWQLMGPADLDSVIDGASYARTLSEALTAGVPFTFLGPWSGATAYKVGQEVNYQGNYWICVSANTNSAPSTTNVHWGLEGTSALLLGAWSNSVAYVEGNQVSLGGNIYSCTAAHTGHTPPNNSYWMLLGPATLDALGDGVNYAKVLASALTNGIPTPYTGAWSSIVNYSPGNETTYTGAYWMCLVANLNSPPNSGNTNWQQIGVTGKEFLGGYSNGTSYVIGNQVTYGSPASYYVCILDSTGNLPTNGTYWQVISSANTNNYLGAYDAGTAYVPGNQVTDSGDFWICISNTTGNEPSVTSGYWTLVGTSAILLGNYSSIFAYVPGHQVIYQNNVYTCILATTGHAPTNGFYWTKIGPSTLDDLPKGIIFDHVLGSTLNNNICAKVSLDGVNTFNAKGVGDPQTLNIDTEVTDGTTYARTAALGLLSGYAVKTGGGGGYTIKGVGDGNSLSLDNDVSDGINYKRVKSSVMVSGVPYTFSGSWSNATNYVVGQSVTYVGNTWLCIVNNTNSAPSTTNTKWALQGTSSLLLGPWSNSVAYIEGNQVTLNGNTYLCTAANTNQTPPNNAYWAIQGPLSIDNLADGITYARPVAVGLTNGIISKISDGITASDVSTYINTTNSLLAGGTLAASTTALQTTNQVGGTTAATSYAQVGSIAINFAANVNTYFGTLTLTQATPASTTFGPTLVGTASAGANWTNPNNIKTNGSSYAVNSPIAGGGPGTFIVGTNAGFSIPADETVTGVTVSFYTLGNAVIDMHNVALYYNGSVLGTPKTPNTVLTAAGTYTYGGTNDMWGNTTAVLTPTVASSSLFGFECQYYNTSGSPSGISVNAFEITVTTTTQTFTAKGRIRIGANDGTEVDLSGAGPTTGTSTITSPASGLQTVIIETAVTSDDGGSVNCTFGNIVSTPVSGAQIS